MKKLFLLLLASLFCTEIGFTQKADTIKTIMHSEKNARSHVDSMYNSGYYKGSDSLRYYSLLVKKFKKRLRYFGELGIFYAYARLYHINNNGFELLEKLRVEKDFFNLNLPVYYMLYYKVSFIKSQFSEADILLLGLFNTGFHAIYSYEKKKPYMKNGNFINDYKIEIGDFYNLNLDIEGYEKRIEDYIRGQDIDISNYCTQNCDTVEVNVFYEQLGSTLPELYD